jgi:yecA family protein
MPSEWLPHFLPSDSEAIDYLGRQVQLIMTAYENVARGLMENRESFGNATLEAIQRDSGKKPLIDWKRGFVRGMALGPDEWNILLYAVPVEVIAPLARIDELREHPDKRGLLDDEAVREHLGRSLGVMTVQLWEAYRRIET